jgi:hypothetical protein
MGFKTGFIIGVIAGAVTAGLTKKSGMDVPVPEGVSDAAHKAAENPQLKGALDKVKKQADQAITAAHEAAAERERELRQRFDELVHKNGE